MSNLRYELEALLNKGDEVQPGREGSSSNQQKEDNYIMLWIALAPITMLLAGLPIIALYATGMGVVCGTTSACERTTTKEEIKELVKLDKLEGELEELNDE